MKTQDPEVIPPSKALAVVPPQGVAAPMNPEELIARAIERGTDVSVMERLLAMRKELRAENAKAAYDRAMASFQAECPIIVKSRAGAKNAYKYAPLDAIVEQVRGLIRKHGFSFAITSEIDAGWVKAFCRVTHEGGHSEVSEFKAPVDDKNPMMTAPQKYGAAMTFAKRYSFCNGFGILTADEDNDGGNRPKPPGPSTLAGEGDARKLAVEVWGLLAKVRGTEKSWKLANEWLWREDLLDAAADERCPDLAPARFRVLIEKLKAHPDLQ